MRKLPKKCVAFYQELKWFYDYEVYPRITSGPFLVMVAMAFLFILDCEPNCDSRILLLVCICAWAFYNSR